MFCEDKKIKAEQIKKGYRIQFCNPFLYRLWKVGAIFKSRMNKLESYTLVVGEVSLLELMSQSFIYNHQKNPGRLIPYPLPVGR